MIYGIGTDICDLRRMRETWERRGDRFAQRVLGAAELEVFQMRLARHPARGLRFLATRFSAKEAFSKAIGLGIRMPMTWSSCEILNEPSGKPVIRLSGVLAEWFAARELVSHVSVTDETDYVAAFVVVERRPPDSSMAPAAPPGSLASPNQAGKT
jgi:holo-[acyl-carrier protein] synthase